MYRNIYKNLNGSHRLKIKQILKLLQKLNMKHLKKYIARDLKVKVHI